MTKKRWCRGDGGKGNRKEVTKKSCCRDDGRNGRSDKSRGGWQNRGGRIDVTKKRWLKRQMEVATVGWQKKGGQKEVAEKR